MAESYRLGGAVRKKILFPLGKLTDEQALKIRYILQVVKDPEKILVSLEDVIPLRSISYLDVAMVNQLWEEWDLSQGFKQELTESPLSTPLVAKILTINRCLEPCSHYGIPEWLTTTALAEILGCNLSGLNDDKIYYELNKIELNKKHLEDYLFRKTYKRDPGSYDFINYDLSSSYFVGFKCKLSEFGRSKDNKLHKKQVLLGIMVNDKGYPFKWDVFPGNVAETDTLKTIIGACHRRFKLKNISLVFDRGIVSKTNLELVDSHDLKYITALDKDQIPQIPGINLSVFSQLNPASSGVDPENIEEQLLKLPQFKKYDGRLFYRDLGVKDKKRYVVGINPSLFLEERKAREQKIETFETFLRNKNEELKQTKRTRKYDPLRGAIEQELARLKIKKFFGELKPKEIEVTTKQKRTIKSYQVEVEKRTTKIDQAALLDGVCAFVTNHIEKEQGKFRFDVERIISAYRNKTQIEDAFKNIKSFVKIRPFNVNTDEHVKAVYTICLLAYFLNRDLANKRKQFEGKDFLNSKELYRPLRTCKLVTLKENIQNKRVSRNIELNREQKAILSKLNMAHLIPGASFA
ncbi:MAG: IS1634 family transposase [Candidatus Hydrothermarchaeales archaeon]